MKKWGNKIIFAILLVVSLFSVFVSAGFMKNDKNYFVGDELRLDFSSYENYVLKIKTPYDVFLKEGSRDIFLFPLNEKGNYTFDLEWSGGVESYQIQVYLDEDDMQDYSEYVDIEEVEVEPLENDVVEIEEDGELDDWEEYRPIIKVGESVLNKRKIRYNESSVRVEVPYVAENVSVNGVPVSPNSNLYSRMVFAISEPKATKEILIENITEDVELVYYTPAPTKEEKLIDERRKEVVVSAPDYLGYENVFVSVSIEDIELDFGELKIYWEEGGRYLDYYFNDVNDDFVFDEVSFFVPHLSTQTFELIVITDAEHLDSNRNLIDYVYEEVLYLDRSGVIVSSGEYLRVKFEQLLNNEKDITIYASSKDGADIDVYKRNSDVKITTFEDVQDYGDYRVLLNNMIDFEDVFDLRVVGGDVFFDYVVDPVMDLILVSESFESTSPYYYNANWTRGSTAWDRETTQSMCGSASAHVDSSGTATNYLTLDSGLSDLSSATAVNVSFWWFCDTDSDNGEYFSYDEYYSGAWHDNVYSYHMASCINQWIYVERDIPASAFQSDFTIRFAAQTNANNEDIYIDCFNVEKTQFVNLPPIHTTPLLSSSLNLNMTTENLTCYAQNVYDDDQSVELVYNWIKNGSSYSVLNLPFNGGSTNTYTKDYSSNYLISSTASYLSSGSHDGSGYYNFAGANSLNISSDVSSIFGDTGTVMFWIRTSQIGDNTIWNAPGIFGVEQSGGGDDIFWGHIDGSGRIGMTAGNGATAYSSSAINNNAWHHVAMTRDSSTGLVQMYIDGSLSSSVTSETGLKTSAFNQIGVIGDTGGTPVYFVGDLDDFMAYDFVLGPQQINAIYNGNYDLIVSEETDVGDNFICEITPNDGFLDGNTLMSNYLLVLPYSIPRIIDVDVLWPTENVDVYLNEFFNVTVNVTCLSGECGYINVTLDPVLQSFENFESGEGGFAHFSVGSGVDQWHRSSEYFNDGAYSFKFGDSGTGNYADNANAYLLTPTYNLEENSTFSFYHYIYSEDSYDGAKLEYSLDGGAWTKVTSFNSGGYNSQFNNWNSIEGFTNSEDVWSGTIGSSGSFQLVDVDMTSFVGSSVAFRLIFASDTNTNYEGWYVDSFNFTTEVPEEVKGVVPMNSGSPFYTITQNPYTTSYLNSGESQTVVFNVNATGDLDSVYEFFVYANVTDALYIGDVSSHWNATIKENTLPVFFDVVSPSGISNDPTPYLNVDVSSGIPNTIWYNVDGGTNEIICSGDCPSSTGISWYNSLWNKRKTIIVPASSVDSDLIDFPLMIQLYDSDIKVSALSSGDDILFTDSSSLKLSHEIEIFDQDYNSTHAHLVSWVKVNLSSTYDNVFYVYYDNPFSSVQENPTEVWSEDYLGVWHLGESGTTKYDSTLNGNDASNSGAASVDGLIGSAEYFDGTDMMVVPRTADLEPTSAITVSLWINRDSVQNQWAKILWYGPNDNAPYGAYGFEFDTDSDSNVRWHTASSSTTYDTAAYTLSSGSWYLLTGVYSGTNSSYYVNGEYVASIINPDGIGDYDGIDGLGFGDKVDTGQKYAGYMDEVTVSGVGRSEDWIVATYDNANSPLSFYSVGGEESFSASGSISKLLYIDSEGSFRANVYANNSNGDVTYNYTDFEINLNNNFYDSFLDNHSVLDFGGAIFDYGSIDYYAEQSSPFFESFETYPVNFTGVADGGNAGCTWYRDSGGTSSSGTGPSDASDGTYYSYVETSNGQGCYVLGDVATMESTEFNITGDGTLLYFDYHMYGTNIGTLYVDVYDGVWQNVWSLSGQQQTSNGADYIEESIDLSDFVGTIQVRFRYSAAGGYRGDAAVDNVRVAEVISRDEVLSRTISVDDVIAEFTNVTWGYSTTGSGDVYLNLSVDNGTSWVTATNGESLVGFTGGNDLVYRIVFEGVNENMSIFDLNISWTNEASPAPNVYINYPITGTVSDVTPVLDFYVDSLASNVWYTINGGAPNAVCSSCFGNMNETLYLREGTYNVVVYTSNSIGEQKSDSVSFTIDMNGNYFDTYLDDSQLWSMNGPYWECGNVSYRDILSGAVLNETFEDSGDWTLSGGTWNIYLDQLRQSGNSVDTFAVNNIFSLEPNNKYNVSMRAYDDDNDETGLVFRYLDSSNYYVCRYNLQGGDSALERVSEGTATTLALISGDYVENSWNSYGVSIDGNISCYLNNQLVATAFDNTWENGKVGIYNSYHSAALYDDFVVETWNDFVDYFVSYPITTLQDIVEVLNVSWNSFSEELGKDVEVEISTDNGANWHEAINGMGLGVLEVDNDLLYRVNYDVLENNLLSLLDLNITWTHSASPAPTITVTPVGSVVADVTPVLTASINGPANTFWYTINNGPANIICTACSSGSYDNVLLLSEGDYDIDFYANNSVGSQSTASVLFEVNMNRNYFDDFWDDSQIALGDYVLGNGNITAIFSGANSSAIPSWDSRVQSGDTTWSNSGRSTYSYRTVVQAGTLNTSGSYARVSFVSGSDTPFEPIRPSICERDGTTSDCVDGTWTRLYFSGMDSYVIPINNFVYTDWAEIEIDETKNYLISYYASSPNDGFSYLSPGSVMTYSLSGVDRSNDEDWSIYSPTFENLIYNIQGLDVISVSPGGNEVVISHPINVSQNIRRIADVTWSSYGDDALNPISIDVSVDYGQNWYSAINGLGVSGFTPGNSLLYRVNFTATDNRLMSLLDLNITWEEPPSVSIEYPLNNYVYNYAITKMNYTVDVSGSEILDDCWYTTDYGVTNYSVVCGDEIAVISVDGVNVWTVYANDSSGAIGSDTVQFIIDTSAPEIVFLNQSSNPVDEGSEFFVNVNVTDSNVDSVWIVIWENVVGGVVKFSGFFGNLFENLFGGSTVIDSSYNLSHNYTVYANDTTGLVSNYTGSFDVLKAFFTLDYNPIYSDGVLPAYIIGHLGLSNGLDLANHPFNVWFDGSLVPVENFTSHGVYLDELNFSGRNDLFGGSLLHNVSDVGGYLTLTGTNTTGSMIGVMDAGALVDWGYVDWDLLSGSCSGTVNYYDGVSWGYSGTEDIYIDSVNPTTNYGVSSELNLDTSPATQRVLLKFSDVFGYGYNKIPYDSSISAAILSTYVYTAGNAPTLYQILEDWDESSATYNGRLPGFSWSSVGVSGSPSRSNTPLGTISATTTGIKSLDILELVRSWNNQSSKNYGVVYNPGGASGVQMRSSEYSTVLERPRLDISFSSSSCAGIEVYYRTSQDKIIWSDWKEAFLGEEIVDDYGMSRYLEYNVVFGSYDGVIKPNLWDIEFNYSALVTDSDGRFNYSFYGPEDFGVYQMNLTSGYRTIYASEGFDLRVQSGIDPVVVLGWPNDNAWFSYADLTILYNATDLNGDLALSSLVIDGVSVLNNQTPLNNGANGFDYTFSQGCHNWSVNVSDSTGLTDVSENRTVCVDLVNPVVELIFPPNEENYTVGYINLSFIPRDNLDSNLTCNVTLDSVNIHENINVGNGSEVNVSSGALVGGTHYWNVSCSDNSGRTTTSPTNEFTITDTPPSVILVSPFDSEVVSSGDVDFVFIPNDNSGITLCELYVDGEVLGNVTNPLVGKNSTISILGILDGFHNWSVTCYDLSSTSADSGNWSFGVDTTGPVIEIFNLPEGFVSYNATPNFDIMITDAIDDELSCQILVSGVVRDYFNATSGVRFNYTSINPFLDGISSWQINCTDDSLYSSVSPARNIDVREAPNIIINNQNNSHISSFDFEVRYVPSDNEGISQCSLYIDGVLNVTSFSVVEDLENLFEPSGFVNGIYDYYVMCVDLDGNSGSSEIYSMTLDTNAPNLEIFFPINEPVYAQNITFNFSANDVYSEEMNCSILVDAVVIDSGISVINGTSVSRVVSGITDGTHDWQLQCVDMAGNVNVSETYNFTRFTAPGVNLISPENNTWLNSSDVNFEYYPMDDEGFDKAELFLNLALEDTDNSVVSNSVNWFNMTLVDGVYDWFVKVTDISLMPSDSEVRRVYVDTNAPVLNLGLPSQNYVYDRNGVDFNFTVSDNLDSEISCDLYLDDSLEWSGNATSGIEETVRLLIVDGNHSYYVSCIDEAMNSIVSSSVNFTVFAPPIVELVSPVNMTKTTNSSINFSYIPWDDLGLIECSVYFDSVKGETSFSIVPNVVNNFTINSISEGFHNWSVECIDTDMNIEMSNYSYFVRDITSPVIQMVYPENNSYVDYNLGSVGFKWNVSDNLDSYIECDLYVDSVLRRPNILIANGSQRTEVIGGLGLGVHNWSVSCNDFTYNENSSDVWVFNYLMPDFEILNFTSNISVGTEGDSVLLNATIWNLGLVNSSNVLVEIYSGYPTSGDLLDSSLFNFTSNENYSMIVETNLSIGLNDFWVVVDRLNSFGEGNEDNNLMSRNISVGAWQFFYGDVNPESEYVLGSSVGEVIVWNISDFSGGTVFVSNKESSVDWSSLMPLGRDIFSLPSLDDFSDADSLLGMTGFSDSIDELYLEGGVVEREAVFDVFGRSVTNVPITNSISSLNFYTGILWDSSDDVNDEYDISDSEDLVFVTEINPDVSGSYGNYDYEIRVPAGLRDYSGSPAEVVFYVEL